VTRATCRLPGLASRRAVEGSPPLPRRACPACPLLSFAPSTFQDPASFQLPRPRSSLPRHSRMCATRIPIARRKRATRNANVHVSGCGVYSRALGCLSIIQTKSKRKCHRASQPGSRVFQHHDMCTPMSFALQSSLFTIQLPTCDTALVSLVSRHACCVTGEGPVASRVASPGSGSLGRRRACGAGGGRHSPFYYT
jgi:hypothetical protein